MDCMWLGRKVSSVRVCIVIDQKELMHHTNDLDFVVTSIWSLNIILNTWMVVINELSPLKMERHCNNRRF
jgi:hypothetical protein